MTAKQKRMRFRRKFYQQSTLPISKTYNLAGCQIDILNDLKAFCNDGIELIHLKRLQK